MSKAFLESHWVETLAQYQTIYVGFSGGLDSTVLLHALVFEPRLSFRVRAVHVNHNLSSNADAWAMHCRDVCEHLGVSFVEHSVMLSAPGNIEEKARNARYDRFKTILDVHDCLVLAHHQDDQAETLLLNLLRGAGVDGLAGMLSKNTLGKGDVIRPMLSRARDELHQYAIQSGLTWIEDESNQDERFSRNFIRHQILPILQKKWPHVSERLSHTAQHCQDAKRNLEALAGLDAVEVSSKQLVLEPLLSLEHERLINVLRVWFKKNQIQSPSSVIYQRLIRELILARDDAKPVIVVGEYAVRRYQNKLYLECEVTNRDGRHRYEWSDFNQPFHFPDGNGTLRTSLTTAGVQLLPGARIEIRYREMGERFNYRNQTKSLKKLFQEWCVPAWKRSKVPLLYINNQLAVVVGFAVSDAFYKEDEPHVYEITHNGV